MRSNFVNIINGSFESSCSCTPEFQAFFNLSKNHFKKTLESIAENIEFSKGHFYFSGFLTRKRDKNIFYFSSGDVRGMQSYGMLIRSAKHYKDFSGGSNNFIKYDDNFESKLIHFINNL